MGAVLFYFLNVRLFIAYGHIENQLGEENMTNLNRFVDKMTRCVMFRKNLNRLLAFYCCLVLLEAAIFLSGNNCDRGRAHSGVVSFSVSRRVLGGA